MTATSASDRTPCRTRRVRERDVAGVEFFWWSHPSSEGREAFVSNCRPESRT